MSTVPIRADQLETNNEAERLFALLCTRRGWDETYLTEIESGEHEPLKDIETLVDALHGAHERGEKVTIAPDFDMDGIASGVLGYAGLSELGFNVELHLPDYRRGHDLRGEDIAEIRAAWPETMHLLTCDGGVNSADGVASARSLGWSTWITDHHQELPPGSSADITVNPCRMDETYTLRGICGANVLHQVLTAYAKAHAPEKAWPIHLLSLFAGLGTVSDVMPLIRENRVLVRDSISIARLLWVDPPRTVPTPWGRLDPDPSAIDIMASPMMSMLALDDHHPVFVRAFTGFATMLKAFAEAKKLRDISDVDEDFYGFYLAPAMNSPRRTEEPLAPCFEVFTATEQADRAAAAEAVIVGNERRKSLVSTYMADLLENEQPLAPWVYLSDAPKGMLGLLANSLMMRHGHPVVVVNPPRSTDPGISGSARAPGWLDVIDTLAEHEGISGIGHQQACGVRAATLEDLPRMAHVLAEASRIALLELGPEERIGDLCLGAGPDCDASLEDHAPLMDLVERVETLAPFGHGHPRPEFEVVVQTQGLKLAVIGSEGQHLRLTTETGLACLWWNSAAEHAEALAQKIEEATPTATMRLLVTLETNTFLGNTRLQAVIREVL